MITTSGKEYYYAVPGLLAPKYMVSEQLMEKLDSFVDWVPKNSENLKNLVGHNTELFNNEMSTLYLLLCDIHAHWLEMEAARILRLNETNEKTLCMKLIIPFIANLRTLAIDIQVAHSKGFETSFRQRNEIERYRDIISSMKIISTLVGSGDFEKAFDIAITNDELKESIYTFPLISSITSRNFERVTQLLSEIIHVYSRKIESINAVVTEAIIRKKIIIVDDMPETLTALNLMLEDHFQIVAFSDGNEALAYLDSGQTSDAFLLDIEMPVMDGFVLAKKIRSRVKYESTPIIFLTGNSAKETIIKAATYGVKAFIVKPANKDTIISKLSNCLD